MKSYRVVPHPTVNLGVRTVSVLVTLGVSRVGRESGRVGGTLQVGVGQVKSGTKRTVETLKTGDVLHLETDYSRHKQIV